MTLYRTDERPHYSEHKKLGFRCGTCMTVWPCDVAEAMGQLAGEIRDWATNHTGEYQHALMEVVAHIEPEE